MPSTCWIRRDLDPEEISRMYFKDKLSTNKIGKSVGCSSQTIRRLLLKDSGMKLRNIREANLVQWSNRTYPEILISSIQDQIIIGTMMGDGSTHIQASSVNPSFSVGHKEADKEYLLWKYSQLETTGLFRNPPYLKVKKAKSREFRSWGMRTIQHPKIKEYHELFHSQNKKVVNQEILDRMGLLGLAVYYQDDGGLRSHRTPYLYTYGWSRSEVELLSTYLQEKWELKFSAKFGEFGPLRKGSHILRMEKESLPRFRELIVPHILPCMSRKVP